MDILKPDFSSPDVLKLWMFFSMDVLPKNLYLRSKVWNFKECEPCMCVMCMCHGGVGYEKSISFVKFLTCCYFHYLKSYLSHSLGTSRCIPIRYVPVRFIPIQDDPIRFIPTSLCFHMFHPWKSLGVQNVLSWFLYPRTFYPQINRVYFQFIFPNFLSFFFGGGGEGIRNTLQNSTNLWVNRVFALI
jgi:hypothetical protein